MNSLNLRVSSVKTGENVRKNAELRTVKLEISPTCVETYRNQSFLTHFLAAKGVPDQVNAVKNIYKNYSSNEMSLKFLSDLYFYSPLKHPVRNQIAKILQSAQSCDLSTTCSALNDSISLLMKSTDDISSCHDLNKLVTSLNGCFDNFPVALQALRQNIGLVIEFVQYGLLKYKCEVSLHTSPSSKNEIYLFIHNLIRFLLACIQDLISNLSLNTKLVINVITASVHDLILDKDMPMDVKTNCGNLIAYTAKINADYINHINRVAAKDVHCENNCVILCHCIGVINTINCKDFQSTSQNFEKIIEKVCAIADRYSTEPSMLLGASRILFQMSKLLLTFDVSATSTKIVVKSMQQYLTRFVLSYLEHHMDSVRHICKDLIRNIIKINAKLEFNDMMDTLFDASTQGDTPPSLRCTILIALCNTIGTKIVLQKIPNLVTDLIDNGLGSDLSVNNCYESLMNANLSEVEFNDWKNLWILPLINLGKTEKHLLDQVEILINKAIKNNPVLVDFLIDVENKDIALSTRLSAIWTIRKNGLKNESLQTHMDGLSAVLKGVMTSNDDDTKIMALRLAVETQKTTEPLTDTECEVLLEFLKYNSNCQSPAIRQRSLALVSKGLLRFNVCFEKALKEGSDRVNYYRLFLVKIMKILAGNLFKGANFSRRSVSLALLEQVVKILQSCSQNIEEYMPEKMISKLIDALNDSYESNKAKAISILKCIVKNGSQNISLRIIKELMISNRPTDSLTSPYCLEYFCLRADPSAFNYHDFQNVKYAVSLAAILWCMEILEDGLRCAQNSILQAARKNPLYGCVLTIKHILSRLEFQELSSENMWRDTFAKLIMLCKSLTGVVGPIVNSSSPEGHLPNDFSNIPEYLGETDDKETGSQNYKVLSSKQINVSEMLRTTPQMVLLCGWRTIKEVSLLLGEIVLRSPIRSELEGPQNYLITADQIIEIGGHFKDLLSETKHRGAFEQAYVGFSKVCSRLWRTSHSKLYTLPMLWLNDLIEIISRDEKINEKICATRRSAGIPFMVQALITSELQVGTTKALACCMKHLIELCSDCSRSTESRMHALNILRALFRCSDLNEAVGEYIADGVMCAIRGYSANTWAERNSSTLLFSALITRIFGVQRTKDWVNLTVRNRMTGRIFFLRYPQLYDFFLDELQEGSLCIQRNERPAKLHPLLLILSRLYPSALEGTESTLKISSFIDYISICSASAEMTTRILTAKAIVAFMTLDTIESRIFQVFDNIEKHAKMEKCSHNNIHGLLLQILYMLRCHKTLENTYLRKVSDNITKVCTMLKPNPVTWKVCLDILLEIFLRPNVKELLIDSSYSIVLINPEMLYSPTFSRLYPVFRKSLFVYNVHAVNIISCQKLFDFLETCFEMYSSLTYEEIETCLNIVLLIMFDANKDIALEHECNDIEINFVKSLSSGNIKTIQEDLATSTNLRKFLKNITVDRRFYPECTIKAYTIMSQLANLDILLTELINKSKQNPDDVKNAMAMCIESYVKSHILRDTELKICLQYLENLSLPWNLDALRHTAVKILHHIVKQTLIKPDCLDWKNLAKLINIILMFSQDDDADVRNLVCQTIVCVSEIDKENICASYVPVVLIRLLSNILKQFYDASSRQNVIEYILVAQQENALSLTHNEDEVDGEVFDKNEANVYGEPYKTLIDCFDSFRECFHDDHMICAFLNSFSEKHCLCQ